MPPLLRISGLTVRFGGLTAVNDVSFDVEAGQFLGVIGPNGAGKTTFIDAVSGLVKSTGSVEFNGLTVSGLPAYQRARAGIGRTFQSLELFEDLTVRENVLCAAERGYWWSVLLDLFRSKPSSSADEAATEALEYVGLLDVAGSMPPDLSLGQRKLVTIARALASTPSLLLLDEPAAGLDSDESLELGRELRALVDRGIAILMVEHDMGLVMAVCDEIKVLEFGSVIAEGVPDIVRTDARVAEAYLGSPEIAEAG
jgi:branched-chain amino acid transport system ATP-binding protein